MKAKNSLNFALILELGIKRLYPISLSNCSNISVGCLSDLKEVKIFRRFRRVRNNMNNKRKEPKTVTVSWLSGLSRCPVSWILKSNECRGKCWVNVLTWLRNVVGGYT